MCNSQQLTRLPREGKRLEIGVRCIRVVLRREIYLHSKSIAMKYPNGNSNLYRFSPSNALKSISSFESRTNLMAMCAIIKYYYLRLGIAYLFEKLYNCCTHFTYGCVCIIYMQRQPQKIHTAVFVWRRMKSHLWPAQCCCYAYVGPRKFLISVRLTNGSVSTRFVRLFVACHASCHRILWFHLLSAIASE